MALAGRRDRGESVCGSATSAFGATAQSAGRGLTEQLVYFLALTVELEQHRVVFKALLRARRLGIIPLFVSTLAPEAARINRAVRQHWGIENSLHWVLGVALHEDHSRKRAGHAAQNFSLLNRIALNLLKTDRLSKLGIHGKRLKAGWDNRYLAALLSD